MKLGKIFLLNMLLIFLLVVGASASGNYIKDDVGVLKQDTITTVNQNLNKIEQNTEVTVKFDVVKSLNGKSIDDYAKKYAKDNIIISLIYLTPSIFLSLSLNSRS
jgi:uncharacterized membrane protein YgcG